jgi:hypothetical protein
MLQSVVRDDQVTVGVSGEQGSRRRDAVATNKDRHAAALGEQHRFITHHRTRGVLANRLCLPGAASVAATDDSRLPAARAQAANQPQHQRRLAAAANGQVADHDHRYRQAMRAQQAAAVEGASQANQQAEQPCQG